MAKMLDVNDKVYQHLYGAEKSLYPTSFSPAMAEGLTGRCRQMYEIWLLSVSGAILIGLSGVFPLLVIPLESGPALKQGEPARKLRLMLSFAVGSLLGDVFLHLLPEVWSNTGEDQESHLTIGFWVISGLMVFLIIEKLIGDENCEFEHVSTQQQDACNKVSVENETKKILRSRESSPLKSRIFLKAYSIRQDKKQKKRRINRTTQSEICQNEAKFEVLQNENSIHNLPSVSGCSLNEFQQDRHDNIMVSGYLNLMANVVDNFTHGLAVSASFCISTKVGLVTTLAILLHEIPHEVGDFAILLRSGFDRWKAAKAQFFTALGGVIGAVTTLTAESAQIAGERTAWILPFTSGGFIYIALVTVVPDLLQEKHGRESFKQLACVSCGVLAMLFVTLTFD